jgi:hypothetical protein
MANNRKKKRAPKPVPERHVKTGNVRLSHNTKEGEWIDVRKGQVRVEGAYVDGRGVLRSTQDNSVVTWHSKSRIREFFGLSGSCQKRGIKPSEIVYDPDTGAPWCPDCWPTELKRREWEDSKELSAEQKIKLSQIFGKN